jgi:hypothetical protein
VGIQCGLKEPLSLRKELDLHRAGHWEAASATQPSTQEGQSVPFPAKNVGEGGFLWENSSPLLTPLLPAGAALRPQLYLRPWSGFWSIKWGPIAPHLRGYFSEPRYPKAATLFPFSKGFGLSPCPMCGPQSLQSTPDNFEWLLSTLSSDELHCKKGILFSMCC